MKPPPPRFPASGRVTARANAVAIAASIALPPRRRIVAADIGRMPFSGHDDMFRERVGVRPERARRAIAAMRQEDSREVSLPVWRARSRPIGHPMPSAEFI